jgi:pyruvate dehydrogenase E1 component beta subunit
MPYRQALHDTLRSELLRDEDVFLMGEEIAVFEGSYKIAAGLLQEFGARRIRDTPICEEAFVGAAFGAAMLGLRPVVEIMTINFSILAMDQILNHGSKIYGMFGGQTPVPMVLRTPGGGGQQLAATHSQNLEVWYAYIPGLKVVAPSTPGDAQGLLTTSIRDNDPVIFAENLALYNTKGEVPEGEHCLEIGCPGHRRAPDARRRQLPPVGALQDARDLHAPPQRHDGGGNASVLRRNFVE